MAERITQIAYFPETFLANLGESPRYFDRAQVRYPMPTHERPGHEECQPYVGGMMGSPTLSAMLFRLASRVGYAVLTLGYSSWRCSRGVS